MSDTDHLDEHIERIMYFIETHQKKIYEGEKVDLSVLEEGITALCQRLNELPLQQARGYSDCLETLFSMVEKLENDVNLQHDVLSEKLKLNENGANPLFAQEIDHQGDN
jgi:hypothetical protein